MDDYEFLKKVSLLDERDRLMEIERALETGSTEEAARLINKRLATIQESLQTISDRRKNG